MTWIMNIGCSLEFKHSFGKYDPAFTKIIKRSFFRDTLYHFGSNGAILQPIPFFKITPESYNCKKGNVKTSYQ